MARIIEQEGGGFNPLVPGHYGAFRALLDDDGQVIQVVPYGQPFVEQDEAPAEQPGHDGVSVEPPGETVQGVTEEAPLVSTGG